MCVNRGGREGRGEKNPRTLADAHKKSPGENRG